MPPYLCAKFPLIRGTGRDSKMIVVRIFRVHMQNGPRLEKYHMNFIRSDKERLFLYDNMDIWYFIYFQGNM